MRPHVAGIEVHVDPALGWGCWRMSYNFKFLPWSMQKTNGREYIVMGSDLWAALDYALNVKPLVLETDPGPLDAKVS